MLLAGQAGTLLGHRAGIQPRWLLKPVCVWWQRRWVIAVAIDARYIHMSTCSVRRQRGMM
eukprot:9452559-Alexandrium_andersonii.AAC.1